MTISLSASSVLATSVTLSLTGQGSNQVEIQVSTRADFEFCLAPIYSVAAASSVAVSKLNQRARYFMRARNRNTDGTTDGWGPTIGIATPLATAQSTAPDNIVVDPAMIVVPETILSILDATASGTAYAGFPVMNLSSDSPTAWQAKGPNGTFTLIFSVAGVAIDTLALLCTNLPEDATWQLFGAATQAAVTGGSPAFTSPSVKFRPSSNLPGRELGFHGLMRLATPQSYPWWRVVITGVPPMSMISAQHLVIGQAIVSKALSTGSFNEQGGDLGSFTRTRSGVADRQRGAPIRHVDFDISLMSEAQYQLLYQGLQYKVNDSMLVIPNPKANSFLHDRMLFGSLTAPKAQRPSALLNTVSLGVDSLI